MFGPKLKQARTDLGLSLRDLAARVPCDAGLLSKLENGRRRPSEAIVARLDELLRARGELIGSSRLEAAASIDAEPWQTAELLQRVQVSDTTPATIEALQATVNELCCAYSRTPALELRAEAHSWLKRVSGLLRKPVGLREHRELLAAAGWLALLVGCCEYDAGMRASAECTRVAARQLGTEAGHADLVGWAHEMSAWFALTQGRYRDVLDAADAGLAVAGDRLVGVQLHAQRAKALGRLGDHAGVRRALERGGEVLSSTPDPERTDNHFVVDPAKLDFYAMDAYRRGGNDARASEHAHAVLASGVLADGTELAPMRVAEARLTLASVAARNGDLEQAVTTGMAAFGSSRRSLPSLTMVAGELEGELTRRYPNEPATEEFRDAMRSLRV
ncbi:MAG: helix-turn-helix transcriptional regulator [Actinocatenispora sp.]